MVTIDNKFDIGQEVYIVRKMREKTVCPACDGIGYKIFMYIENDEMKTVVKYKLKNGTEFVERSLFATREEAEARCKELNEQL